MEQQEDLQSCMVVWRGQKFVIEINQRATLKEFGEKLQELTNVKADTLRLLVPVGKSSKMLYPFNEEHAHLSLDSTSVLQGKSIRMMGVPEDEVDEILQNAKVDLRIAGFDDEEKRFKQGSVDGSYALPKLPQGNYIFCDFRTLSLPGIELNPPPSKALELLHKLASDRGIVAIMNKHRWRVGILTEMAPIGYVGVSPKCILGFNKNHGEEISLRLRTDDLKGFRKYASIKKTLLHELAHMVFSEHDSNFYALDKQLNKEADALDWTKSRGHTLAGVTLSQHFEEDFDVSSNVPSSKKLGGEASVLPNARAASVNAAFQRLANTSPTLSRSSEEPTAVPNSGVLGNGNVSEPDPDDSGGDESMVLEPYVESGRSQVDIEMIPHHIPDPLPSSDTENDKLYNSDNLEVNLTGPISVGEFQRKVAMLEPEPDYSAAEDPNHLRFQNTVQPDQMDFLTPKSIELPSMSAPGEPHSKDPHPEEMADYDMAIERIQTVEPDPDDSELQIIQDPVTLVCSRLQSAIQSLKNEVNPSETAKVLETLTKIICNVIEHPDDIKFKKLRKANPMIQRTIIAYKAAVDILTLIGFVEDVIINEWGKSEVFFMLKRNDPGLLWLAKSSLETNIS